MVGGQCSTPKTSRRTSRGLRVMRKLTFELRSPIHQQNAIQAIQQILPDPTKPIVVTIQERNRSIRQNARLHAMLSEISKKATYHGKARNIEFWKGLFVSGWQIATNQHPEIISGLEGELINIRESTATLSVKKISEIMDYIEAYCAMNSIHLSEWRNYDWGLGRYRRDSRLAIKEISGLLRGKLQ